MDLNEFSREYPEMYRRMDGKVRDFIRGNNVTGNMSLVEWNNMIDRLMYDTEPYWDDDDYYGGAIATGQLDSPKTAGYGSTSAWAPAVLPVQYGQDFDRRRRRRRRDDRFDRRDILRLLFLRLLFG